MWPSWKLPELTSENLNRLQLEDKESQIIINVSTDKRNGSNVTGFEKTRLPRTIINN